jgi:TRAP transporter 4TM/12TM fusion protein
MKKTGFSKEKAGAIEVSSSVNGQIMPPVMGAAAFVMASFIGVTYFEVVKHAFLPAIICYVALFYISHLEALKLNLKGMDDEDVPNLKKTFLSGLHFLIPIFVLIFLLVYMRFTASYSIFYATLSLILVNFLNKIIKESNFRNGLITWFNQTIVGFEKGAINMVGVGIAIATAGVIVGAVGSTGLSTNLIIVIESIAKDNIVILIFLTMILCLLLGMGLPTTANYVVVASLMATVLVDVGNAAGFIFPLIAVHLFVFYFGLMADVTPPVGLASYAAAAISGGDPIKTGVQAFWYEIRTAVLPIIFLFNHELLLIGIENIWHAILVIITSLIGILVFSAATQGWFINKLRWFEIIIFFVISISFLSPEFVLNKFYPKFNYINLNDANTAILQSKKDVHIKITRPNPYGERYKLFEIKKGTFDEEFNLEKYGLNLVKKDNQIVVDTLDWKGEAKKSGFEMNDIITELKIENFDRPNKDIVYIFSFIALLIFGFLNYKKYRFSDKLH